MGKGQIISGGTGGEYQVKILYNRDRYDDIISALDEKKAELAKVINGDPEADPVTQEEKYKGLQLLYDEKSLEVDAAIVELNLLIDEFKDLYLELEALQIELGNWRSLLVQYQGELVDLQEQVPPAPPATIEAKELQITETETEISNTQTEISDKEKEISDKQTEVETKQLEASGLDFERAIIGQQIAEVELQITSIDKKKEYLEENMPADATVSAWCADLTEDLSGYVGTVEIPGERIGDHGNLQIQPGYDSNAVYDSDRDGQLFPTIAVTPAQAFYNAAMLPGWQKWKPLFRYGTINAITDSLASVTLDATVKSSQQDLAINQSATLTDVPFEYMSCDGSAFAVDDEVLIMFIDQDFADPKIIGFKTDPVGCCSFSENFTDGTFDCEWSTEYAALLASFIESGDEYYYHVLANGDLYGLDYWYLQQGCGDYPDNNCWTHSDLIFRADINNISKTDSLNSYVMTSISSRVGDTFPTVYFYHDRTEGPFPVAHEYLNDEGFGDVLFAVGDGEIEIDLTEEPYSTILSGGKVSAINLRVKKATADINYFRLCETGGADPMQEPE